MSARQARYETRARSIRRQLHSEYVSGHGAPAKDHARGNWESGPTRLIVYCADYKCAHSILVDGGRAGAMTSACPIWSRDLPVRFAAIAVQTSGRCSNTRAWEPVSSAHRSSPNHGDAAGSELRSRSFFEHSSDRLVGAGPGWDLRVSGRPARHPPYQPPSPGGAVPRARLPLFPVQIREGQNELVNSIKRTQSDLRGRDFISAYIRYTP